jgi:hypothetical protein
LCSPAYILFQEPTFVQSPNGSSTIPGESPTIQVNYLKIQEATAIQVNYPGIQVNDLKFQVNYLKIQGDTEVPSELLGDPSELPEDPSEPPQDTRGYESA